jgi:hypothetical protein
LLTEPRPVEIEVPLHRKSSVEPRIVTKRQWWLSGVDDLVISLSARYSQCGLRPQKLK